MGRNKYLVGKKYGIIGKIQSWGGSVMKCLEYVNVEYTLNLFAAVPKNYKVFGLIKDLSGKELFYPIKELASFQEENENDGAYSALIGGYRNEIFTPMIVFSLIHFLIRRDFKENLCVRDFNGRSSYISDIIVSDEEERVYFVWAYPEPNMYLSEYNGTHIGVTYSRSDDGYRVLTFKKYLGITSHGVRIRASISYDENEDVIDGKVTDFSDEEKRVFSDCAIDVIEKVKKAG